MATTDFQFVIGDRPEQLKASRLKSHISKRGWAAYRASLKKNHVTIPDSQQGQIPPAREDRRNLKPRRSSKQTAVTYELTCGLDGESPRSNGHSMPPGHRQRTLAHPIEYQLGGGRIDPFQAHAGQRGFHVPALVDHYVVHMAVDIAEIDEPGAPGLLRTKWFPMVRSEPACFEVVMLLSAFNMVSLNKHTGMASILLQLKASAIDRINDDLARGLGNSKSLCDGTIGAVAKMASFEAMHGDQRSYAVHMAGLKRMIELRGGLDCLGLDGLLRRIVIWIDVNSSFLLNTSRYFPGEHFTTSEVAIEPNPAAFIAA